MFKNYDNLSKEYIPNNSFTEEDYIYKAVDTNLPYELYNIKEEHIGYGWAKEAYFDLEVPFDLSFYVPTDSVIFETSGMCPTLSTFSREGQKAYNVKDMISWTCKRFGNTGILWEQDNDLEVCKDKGFEVKFTPNSLDIKMIITNFRYEKIFEKSFNVSSDKLYVDTKELDLDNGVYNVEIYGLSKYKGLIKSFLFSVGKYSLENANLPVTKSDEETERKRIVYDGTDDLSMTSQKVQVIYDGGLLTL